MAPPSEKKLFFYWVCVSKSHPRTHKWRQGCKLTLCECDCHNLDSCEYNYFCSNSIFINATSVCSALFCAMYQHPAKAIVVTAITAILLTLSLTFWTLGVNFTWSIHSLHLSTTQTRPITFRRKPEFSNLSRDFDAQWSSLLPSNGGFVSRPKPDGRGNEMFAVSMFHQLHCLQIIRGTIQELMEAKVNPVKSFPMDEVPPEALKYMELFGIRKRDTAGSTSEDWTQCFDYLMQGIFCAADGTLEPSRTNEGGKLVADSYEVTHQCRNADRLWETAMGEQRVSAQEVRREGTDLKL